MSTCDSGQESGVTTRQTILQIHRWVGLVIGVYAVLIGVSGSILVFRQNLQALRYPQFFSVDRTEEPDAALSAILAALSRAYPAYAISGVDWPTYRRDTFLAYVSRGTEFKTVFIHPVTGQVTGELPYDWIRWLQDLHFNLHGGDTGLMINGIAAGLLLLMCVTGVIVWWPGIARWRRHLRVDFSRGWKRLTWELHGAAGMWTLLWLLMWSLTGLYFANSQPFRTVINAVSPLTVPRVPESERRGAGARPPEPEALLALALERTPGASPARFVMPFGERGTFVVVLAREVHGDWNTADEMTFYFDRYSGALLASRDGDDRSAGDALLSSFGLLHVGSLWGPVVQVLWAITGLTFPLLFLTGFVMWWNKIGRWP